MLCCMAFCLCYAGNNALAMSSDSLAGSRIYSSLEFRKVFSGVNTSISEFRSGLFVRNGPLISGLAVGFQRINSVTDSLITRYHQVPIYWSNYIFLRKNVRVGSPFFRVDIGLILAEDASSMKSSDATANTRKRLLARNIASPTFQAGLGYKLPLNDDKSGFTIEAGYKYLPAYAPTKTKNDFIYLGLGFLF